MASDAFGIYILTYPGDFHLSTMLVRSIQQVSPDIPIMIIPGEGFDRNNHPFDVPIMSEPKGFWAEIGHQDRDFWAFQGPFETFLYMDADTLCVKSLDSLAQRIAGQQGDFIYVQPWMSDEDWLAILKDQSHPDHEHYLQGVRNEVGPAVLLEFDPEHDFFAHKFFNSGVFASRRFAISESDLASLNRAEREFYRNTLNIEEWTWKSSDLFFRDQGRLNYLVHKLGIPVFPIVPEVVCRSGADAIRVSFEDVENKTTDFHVIHWMGSKSPSSSYFCSGLPFSVYASLWSNVGRKTGRIVSPGYERLSECTGYSVWRHYYTQQYGVMPLGERLRWSWPDLRKTAKLCIRSLKLLARSVMAKNN